MIVPWGHIVLIRVLAATATATAAAALVERQRTVWDSKSIRSSSSNSKTGEAAVRSSNAKGLHCEGGRGHVVATKGPGDRLCCTPP